MIVKDMHIGQFLYLGRWVDKKTFRAFVYDKDGNQMLADNYDQYIKFTSSGNWFSEKPDAPDNKKVRKQKNDTIPDGK